jgi:hypothetical protein
MGDELIERGNLSRVDPSAYQAGQVFPDNKGRGTAYTGDDSYQVMRDKFPSRNASHPQVVDINARNRAHYRR